MDNLYLWPLIPVALYAAVFPRNIWGLIRLVYWILRALLVIAVVFWLGLSLRGLL